MSIRVGTRASALAVAQTRMTADLMSAAAGVPVELVRIESDGDRMPAGCDRYFGVAARGRVRGGTVRRIAAMVKPSCYRRKR